MEDEKKLYEEIIEQWLEQQVSVSGPQYFSSKQILYAIEDTVSVTLDEVTEYMQHHGYILIDWNGSLRWRVYNTYIPEEGIGGSDASVEAED